jgi:hypothetical protein
MPDVQRLSPAMVPLWQMNVSSLFGDWQPLYPVTKNTAGHAAG